MNIKGHHHISMYTKNAVNNKKFYTDILGLRLVEKTVNQDNTTMYHLFYGDEVGSPGTLLTFFELPTSGQTRKGTNSIYRFSLLVPSEEALRFFAKRLEESQIKSEWLTYLGQPAITFEDWDGLEIILIVNDKYNYPNTWSKNKYSDIPYDYQILGMGPVELRVKKVHSTESFLTKALGYKKDNRFSENVYTLNQEGLYTEFVIVEQEGDIVRPGKGYIHHIAVDVPTDQALNEIHKKIDELPGNNSGIIDRYFFKSLYYRQNSILYEFATSEPGFLVDTTKEQLGEKLNLPDFLEERREEIEEKLEKL